MLQNVIISGSYGIFEPNDEYQALLDKKGLNWWDMEARTDKEIVKFVEDHYYDNECEVSLIGKEDYQYVSVDEVDTSIPWTINEYDGAEYVKYIKYSVIDKELNYCKFD
jgi:hypothetical protein